MPLTPTRRAARLGFLLLLVWQGPTLIRWSVADLQATADAAIVLTGITACLAVAYGFRNWQVGRRWRVQGRLPTWRR